ncbi:MAG: acylphosphatase [Candidatus Diapherotrites archaeon]|nr:acylphosphatase [Candidatus Diapherotrites archaeon]
MAIARILVFGNVQGVGFRAYAKQIAKNMQIRGFARNLDDGSVEIYARAAKPETYAFIEKINIKGNPSDPLSLHVGKIKVLFGGDEEFIMPGRGLGVFEIDYGKELSLENREMIEKAEIATLMMHSLNSKTDSLMSETKSFRKESSNNLKRLENTLGGKTDSFRKETSSNFKRLENTLGGKTDTFRKETSNNFKRLGSTLGGKTDSFRKETSNNFSKLDGKYGSVSKTLKGINNSIKTMGGSVKRMGRDMKQSNKILSKIARNFDAAQ